MPGLLDGDAVGELLGDPLERSDGEVLWQVLGETLGRIPGNSLGDALELSAR